MTSSSRDCSPVTSVLVLVDAMGALTVTDMNAVAASFNLLVSGSGTGPDELSLDDVTFITSTGDSPSMDQPVLSIGFTAIPGSTADNLLLLLLCN